MRLIGIDLGKARVGIATAIGNFVQPIKVSKRAQNQAQKEILKLIQDFNPDKIVLGLPLSEDNSHNPQCEDIKMFARRLSKRCVTPIEFEDEYYSTVEARERVANRGKAVGDLDAISACIILERYISKQSQ